VRIDNEVEGRCSAVVLGDDTAPRAVIFMNNAHARPTIACTSSRPKADGGLGDRRRRKLGGSTRERHNLRMPCSVFGKPLVGAGVRMDDQSSVKARSAHDIRGQAAAPWRA
jgi:hypothetical protein